VAATVTGCTTALLMLMAERLLRLWMTECAVPALLPHDRPWACGCGRSRRGVSMERANAYDVALVL